MVCTILAVIAGGLALWTIYETFNCYHRYSDLKDSFGLLNVHPTSAGLGYASQFDPNLIGAVVHVNIPQSDLLLDHYVTDPAFGINVPGAITLNRRVEYCQWREHYVEKTEKTGQDTERVVRTYYYTKGWTSAPINSLFFDQPAAHHNPQRRPYEQGPVDVTGIRSGSGFSVSAPYMDNIKGQTLTFYFRPDTLQGFLTSPAYLTHKFFYTGDKGWFLSKYEPSTAETAMKMAFQYAEGTLLDFQLGDLFSTCDAGDVRVAFEGKTIQNGVSLVALLNQDGSLSPFKTLKGKDVMLVQEGQLTAKEMMDRETGDIFTSFIWFLVGAIASVGVCVLCASQAANKKKALEQQPNENNAIKAE